MAQATRQLTRRAARAAVILSLVTTAAFSAEAPSVPASAKRLGNDAIVALYDGKTFAFQSFTHFGIATGTVTYDFASKTNKGTYKIGPHSGTFGGPISVSDDKFCFVARGSEHCHYVYIDGSDIYEVKQSGVVDSVKQAAPAPQSEAGAAPQQ